MEEKEIYRAVIYTDGSMMHPINRDIGYTGSSAHGYIYNVKSIGIPNKDNPNSMVTPTFQGYGTAVNNDIKVTPDIYIDALYTRKELLSNNVAELLAITNTIDNLISYSKENNKHINIIYVLSDSAYALHVYDSIIENNIVNIDTKPNSKLWYLIIEQIKVCKELGIIILTKKIKGHSGNFGNDLADVLANQARVITEKNIEVLKLQEEKHYFKITDAKKYWKPNIDRNPFLTVKSLFFLQTDRKKENEKRYSIMDYPTNKELGTSTSEALYGLLYVKDVSLSQDFIDIENVLDKDKEVVGTLGTLSEIYMDNLYNRKHLHYKEILGDLVYKTNKYRTGISALDLNLTLRTFQGLAKLTYNKTIELENVYENFINNIEDENIKIIDITDNLYDTIYTKAKIPLPKKQCKIDMKDKTIDLTYELYNQKVKICLNLGTEILNRNILKRLEKDIVSVKVHLIKKGKMLEVSTIVSTDNIVGVYTNLFTRYILLK